MRMLHTSDWHVGKTLKGRSRLDEHRLVLADIVEIARTHEVDAVLIAGDLYDSTVPSAEAQRLVVKTLLDLRSTGAEVLVIAGNHDHPRTFDAYRPLMAAVGITMLGGFLPAGSGGLVSFRARSTGEPVNVAVLPFLSQRYAVRAADLIGGTAAEHTAGYDQLVRDVLADLVSGFTADAVNVVMSHLTVLGGLIGGGERSAQSIFEYCVPATIFPAEAHYVALGHLHRRQTLPAPCPVAYCGSPLAIDFGEQENRNVVCLVRAAPTTPAQVTDLPVAGGRRLRTVRGTAADIIAQAADFGDDFLRVFVREPARAGLRDEVTEALPNALEVRIDPEFAAAAGRPTRSSHAGKTPHQLLAEYCAERGMNDPRVLSLFDRIHDELSTAGAGD